MPSVATASVTQSLAGEASLGASGGAGVGAASGAGVGAAQGAGGAPTHGPGDQVVGLLTQLVARLPQAIPEQAPGASLLAGAQQGASFIGQPGAAFVGQHGAAVVGHPPYLEMMRETRVCFHCREPGHLRPMCPKLQQMSVASVQPVAAQPVSQITAVQPLGQIGESPRVYSSAEVGQTSQSGQIHVKFLTQTS